MQQQKFHNQQKRNAKCVEGVENLSLLLFF
jgi:hypothetical protein